MDASPLQDNSFVQPKSIADRLPELRAMLFEDARKSTKKKPQCVPVTTEKFKPLTIAELQFALNSTTKKPQASTVKKRINSTLNGRNNGMGEPHLKKNTVKKVLNFHQPQPAPSTFRAPTVPDRFPKPDIKANTKKLPTTNTRARDVRISGVHRMPETPVVKKKPVNSRYTMANKENFAAAKRTNIPKYNHTHLRPPSPKLSKRSIAHAIPDTPLSNDSWKSSCDASFLQREKEIHDVVENLNIPEKRDLQNIIESPQVSTPFKEYRDVNDYFINTSNMDATVINDNTILCLDKQSITIEKETSEMKEESIIASLCDLFSKATVTNADQPKSEMEILLEIKRETENNIRTQMKLLQYVNDLIQNKTGSNVKTIIEKVSATLVVSQDNLKLSPVVARRVSVIKSPVRSPTYKIPKKSCLRKKVFHKSMPEISNRAVTPEKVMVKTTSNKALNMYMQMKEQMNFLNTPKMKQSQALPDTPAITSRNLQVQLDKLFGS